jgi:hypothetical protein
MSSEDNKNNKILPMKQRPHVFLKTVRDLAADSGNIRWSNHARKRFCERDISNRMAVNVLRKGRISGDIVAGKFAGEWKAKLVYPFPGKREVGVATILQKGSRIYVKTVEWED